MESYNIKLVSWVTISKEDVNNRDEAAETAKREFRENFSTGLYPIEVEKIVVEGEN